MSKTPVLKYKFIVCNVLILLLLSIFVLQGDSGDALRYVPNSDTPVLWPTESYPVEYNIDLGDLGSITHDEAVAIVQNAFTQWGDIEEASITFQQGSMISVDVKGDNFTPYINGSIDNLNPIIFDHDGSIVNSVFGYGAENSVLGFGGPLVTSNSSILSAHAVFNGKIIESYGFSKEFLLSTVLHEIGHFIGLDHSQLFRHLAYNFVGVDDVHVPIMLPTSADNDDYRTVLTDEDKYTLYNQYPSSTSNPYSGNIEGVVKRGDEEIPGVNVIARTIYSVTDQTFTTVTGTVDRNRGTFRFNNIPAGLYQLQIEPIDPSYYGASSVGRFAQSRNSRSFVNSPPSQFYSNQEELTASRSEWTPVFVFPKETTNDIVFYTGSESSSSDETNTKLLGFNLEEAGAIQGFGMTSFQFVVDAAGSEPSIVISVQSDELSSKFELIVVKDRIVTISDLPLQQSESGFASVIIGSNGHISLENTRYFIALRNRAGGDFTYKIRADIKSIPIPTPTAIEVNPQLGIVGLDNIGGTFTAGSAVHNFDTGITDIDGTFHSSGVFDGLPDPLNFSPLLYLDSMFYPIVKDFEFSGEIVGDRNGSEGAYFLIGGNVGLIPPVSVRLGATGGSNNGGIDLNNDPSDNLNFGSFRGDYIPVITEEDENGIVFFDFLVDIEPAGNRGFYVLERSGKIFAEGDALESIELSTPPDGIYADAVDFEIYRGNTISLSNSCYSDDLIGTGAYILDSYGIIYPIGDVPSVDTTYLPLVNDLSTDYYYDLELIPDPTGAEWIGLGILRYDGIILFVPFDGFVINDEVERYIDSLNPFGEDGIGFSFDIARDFDVEISDSPLLGLDDNGNTTFTTYRRIGIFLLDGFGGIHTGGHSTRYVPGIGMDGEDIRIVDGRSFIPLPASIPYLGIDVVRDIELAPQVYRN
jgi:hypothetical protein